MGHAIRVLDAYRLRLGFGPMAYLYSEAGVLLQNARHPRQRGEAEGQVEVEAAEARWQLRLGLLGRGEGRKLGVEGLHEDGNHTAIGRRNVWQHKAAGKTPAS